MTNNRRALILAVTVSLYLGAAVQSHAQSQEDAAHLSKQLNNPVSSLISVPLQLNYNESIGTNDDGSSWTLLVQPVLPFSLNENWNLISRTILPLQWTDDITSSTNSDFRVDDITQSFFLFAEATYGRRLDMGRWPGGCARWLCCYFRGLLTAPSSGPANGAVV